MICLKISIFVASTTTVGFFQSNLKQLWFAWKYLSLWHQQQRRCTVVQVRKCCDLLENIYLCGINNNVVWEEGILRTVVICLKISIFVASTTTQGKPSFDVISLWFAWKYLSLWHQQQPYTFYISNWTRCDLLENIYLCGINNNPRPWPCLVAVVVICLKISIFVASTTTLPQNHPHFTPLWFAWKYLSLWHQQQRLSSAAKLEQLWFAWKYLSLWHQQQRRPAGYVPPAVVICLKISIFVASTTTLFCGIASTSSLWFAWKYLSLWHQQQPPIWCCVRMMCCDLLENIYLCGINNNDRGNISEHPLVVICLKISIFVASTTTPLFHLSYPYWLWFAWKYLSLWHQQQQQDIALRWWICCDLLENIYLCGINNNGLFKRIFAQCVVICLKISIFVASTTTCGGRHSDCHRLWFAWKYLSLWHQQQLHTRANIIYFRCDLLENIYLCGINNNMR